MKEKINQKGFIQIPLLIAIIVAVVLASGVTTGVFLHKQGKLTPFLASVSKVFESTEGIETEIKPEEPQPKEEQSPSEEIAQKESSPVEQGLEQAKLESEKARLESEKAKQEAEKVKTELEQLKLKIEAEKLKPETQEAKEQEEQIGGTSKISNQELSRFISQLREGIEVFSQAIKEGDEFIPTVRNTMGKYPNFLLVQRSGQDLINEVNNLSFVSKKLIDIENKRIEILSSLFDLDEIPLSALNEFSELTTQYENYRNQYDSSNAKIKPLMETFVIHEKVALEETLKQGEEELLRKTKAAQAKAELNTTIQSLDNQLAILNGQIKEKEEEIEMERNRLAPMELIELRIAQLIPELNALIAQWNALISLRGKIVTVIYKIDDYFYYGTPFSAEDRTFLLSLGISF